VIAQVHHAVFGVPHHVWPVFGEDRAGLLVHQRFKGAGAGALLLDDRVEVLLELHHLINYEIVVAVLTNVALHRQLCLIEAGDRLASAAIPAHHPGATHHPVTAHHAPGASGAAVHYAARAHTVIPRRGGATATHHSGEA